MLKLLRLILVLVSLALPAVADVADVAVENKEALEKIEKYINSLTTAKGRFKQLTSTGDYSMGDFYLSRPGKLRLDYDSPNNIQLISDGKDLIYYNKDLVQVTYLGLDSSIANILVTDDFKFSNPDLLVENIAFVEDTIMVTISSAKDSLIGKMILVFNKEPLELTSWQVIDAQGIVTTVSLADMEYGLDLNKELFKFKDPRHNNDYFNRRN